MLSHRLLAWGVACLFGISSAPVFAAESSVISPHEAARRGLVPSFPSDLPTPPLPTPLVEPLTFDRMVMGYYSTFQGTPANFIPYTHLTHLAWFGVDVDSTGNVTTNGWGATAAKAIVDTAHSYGVKVLVTAVEFDATTICTLVSSSTNRSKLISNLLAQVQAGNGDGVALDFETPNSSCMTGFEQLTRDLATALHGASSAYHLSLALSPVDWSHAFHYDVLAASADSLFIMGYNFHYSSGAPGPNDPLLASSTWGSYCLDWSVKDYISKAGAYKDRLILGLPLYGYDWPTTNTNVPGSPSASAVSIRWKEAQEGAAKYGARYDIGSDSPYYTYAAGSQAHQVWFDDVPGMSDRFEYINQQDIGGVGFWALGYDQLDADLWEEVDLAFGSVQTPATGDLVGYIRENDIYSGAGIPGALVALSSGQRTTTDANGYYAFQGMPASITYTVTASADCYTTVSDSKQVAAGIQNWKSIALTPASCSDDGADPGCSGQALLPSGNVPAAPRKGVRPGLLLGLSALAFSIRRNQR